jgi:hypothetical protein
MDFYLSDMPESEYEKDAEPGQLKDKQLAATRIFAVRDAPGIIPIGAEVEINLDINPYVPRALRDRLAEPVRPINMKIDVMTKDTTTFVQDHDEGVAVDVTDYKFVTRKKTQAEVNTSPQITTYLVGLRDLTGKWPSKAGIRMFHPGSMSKKPKADDPTPDSIPLMREKRAHDPGCPATPDDPRGLTSSRRPNAASAREIFIQTDDPQTCSWCGFRDRCQSSLVNDLEAQKIREAA